MISTKWLGFSDTCLHSDWLKLQNLPSLRILYSFCSSPSPLLWFSRSHFTLCMHSLLWPKAKTECYAELWGSFSMPLPVFCCSTLSILATSAALTPSLSSAWGDQGSKFGLQFPVVHFEKCPLADCRGECKASFAWFPFLKDQTLLSVLQSGFCFVPRCTVVYSRRIIPISNNLS